MKSCSRVLWSLSSWMRGLVVSWSLFVFFLFCFVINLSVCLSFFFFFSISRCVSCSRSLSSWMRVSCSLVSFRSFRGCSFYVFFFFICRFVFCFFLSISLCLSFKVSLFSFFRGCSFLRFFFICLFVSRFFDFFFLYLTLSRFRSLSSWMHLSVLCSLSFHLFVVLSTCSLPSLFASLPV